MPRSLLRARRSRRVLRTLGAFLGTVMLCDCQFDRAGVGDFTVDAVVDVPDSDGSDVAVDVAETEAPGPVCNDLIKNGDESDVDCGGVVCPGCASGKKCNGDTDCLSSLC